MNIKKKNITFREISIHQTIIRRLKLSLVFTCVLHSSISTARCGHFDLDDVNEETYVQNYNKLPTVETNDNLLKESPHFNSFLKEAEEIVTRYEFESYVGFRLIHQHFSAGNDQIIAEEFQMTNETPSLVTRAYSFEEAKEKGAIPASWIFSNNSHESPLVFEASTDTAVKVGSQKLKENPDFMKEMSTLLYNKGLSNLLAVSLLKRDALAGEEDQMYIEKISSDGNVSILQLGYSNEQPSNIIRTSWSFKGPKQQGCIVISGCQPLPKGGHISVSYHQKI